MIVITDHHFLDFNFIAPIPQYIDESIKTHKILERTLEYDNNMESVKGINT